MTSTNFCLNQENYLTVIDSKEKIMIRWIEWLYNYAITTKSL